MERTIKEILTEMFKGKDSAIEKYAKVRATQYELSLWRRYHLPLSEVDKGAKAYFAQRFLGMNINSASERELKDALERLDHAVNDGCHGRCERLVEELNGALLEMELRCVKDVQKFLDWLTFFYHTNPDFNGDIAKEPEYGFEIRIFADKENRKEFWEELQALLKQGRMMSMQDVCKLVLIKRKASKKIPASTSKS